MTRAEEPPRRRRAVVTDLDEARRRRAPSAAGTDARGANRDGAPIDPADPIAVAGAAPAKPARRRRDPANRRFDAVKVERLRREIAQGRYEIDPFSVADRFIEHERNRR